MTRLTLALLVACVATVATVSATGAHADPAPDRCGPWQVSTAASGFRSLENLAFDGSGGLLLADHPQFEIGSIQRLSADGVRTTVVPEVKGPGGIVVDGRTAYFTTHDDASSGLLGIADGTIESVDLSSGEHATVARGLVMPNGLVRTPNGEFVTTRNLGTTLGLTVIRTDGTFYTVHQEFGTTNGIALSNDGATVYVGTSYDLETRIWALPTDNLAGPARLLTLPGFGPLNFADNLTVGPDGWLYVPLFAAGSVVRVDPATGRSCTIVTGVQSISSIAFGEGEGWDPESAYTTGFDGTIHRLTP